MHDVSHNLASHPIANALEPTIYGCVQAFVEEMVRAGVGHACVSPGARNTPLVLALAARAEVHAWSHVDERSGSFFALGIAKATRSPVAIVCTSGTAAANFYPAVIEARYAHVPLLVLTADRPAELRDCDAAQSIDQIKLYGNHVKWFVEVGGVEAGDRYFRSLACQAVATARELPAGPVHLNFPFREPLLPLPRGVESSNGPSPARQDACASVYRSELRPTAASLDSIATLVAATPRGLIACGPSDALAETSAAIIRLAATTGYPLLADPTSQLRGRRYASPLLVDSYDVLLRDDQTAANLAPDIVFRIGPMPTAKAFARYLDSHPGVRQIVLDADGSWNDPFHLMTDLLRGEATFTCDALSDRIASLRRSGQLIDCDWQDRWLAAAARVRRSLSSQVENLDEMFEGKVFSELARRLPDGACLYVGNSMAIRDLESFWPGGGPDLRFLCNRGVNGIDGFLSSGLGAAAASAGPVVIVTGDLGFYHDLNGLLAVKRYGLRAVIILLNNDGGGIFSYLPQADCGSAFGEYFLTSHGLDFRAAAEMYGCEFRRAASWPDFRAALDDGLRFAGTMVVEVPVNRERSVELHRDMWERAARAAAEVG